MDNDDITHQETGPSLDDEFIGRCTDACTKMLSHDGYKWWPLQKTPLFIRRFLWQRPLNMLVPSPQLLVTPIDSCLREDVLAKPLSINRCSRLKGKEIQLFTNLDGVIWISVGRHFWYTPPYTSGQSSNFLYPHNTGIYQCAARFSCYFPSSFF